ncbi:Uncharacterized protein OBRU01_10803 [Operophtera brumata]|uniref:Uncharacterized protein n=1 Tax=Operophtera brumata TaxID=104452 RepID=A0A0L7L472_OPEBR|nr:Uncharacterized protein OBRU01_10803 [Operophtera brumata]
MQMAADQNPKFKFEASEWPNGHYVHTLGGHKEEPMGYHYWLLYRLPETPDPASPPGNQLVAPVGKCTCTRWETQGGADGLPLLAAVPPAGDTRPSQPTRQPARRTSW